MVQQGVDGGHQGRQDLPAPCRNCIHIRKPTQRASFSAQGEKKRTNASTQIMEFSVSLLTLSSYSTLRGFYWAQLPMLPQHQIKIINVTLKKKTSNKISNSVTDCSVGQKVSTIFFSRACIEHQQFQVAQCLTYCLCDFGEDSCWQHQNPSPHLICVHLPCYF